MIYSYLPGHYLFLSRLKSKPEKLSWAILYVIPLLFISGHINGSYSIEIVILFILALLSFFSIYDLGYIENDVKTVLTEKEPTLRIDSATFDYYTSNYWKHNLIKILFSVVLILAIDSLSGLWEIELNLLAFICAVIATRFVFFFHNKIRSRYNVLTFSLLSSLKYTSILILFCPYEQFPYYLTLSLLMFPLIRTIEHATKKKYKFIKIRNLVFSADYFRVRYYLLFSLIFLVVAFLV
ncbi:hypothetical protein AB4245_26070, partial [Vibrio splendidus]